MGIAMTWLFASLYKIPFPIAIKNILFEFINSLSSFPLSHWRQNISLEYKTKHIPRDVQ